MAYHTHFENACREGGGRAEFRVATALWWDYNRTVPSFVRDLLRLGEGATPFRRSYASLPGDRQ